ncbi:MAG: hypothetical protein ABR498_03450 [Candidatus Dormibacteria bacterium]
MNLLVFKLTLTPLAVGLATLVGRRWGPSFGGWIAGIPFTSTPVVIFITLDHGVDFGSLTAAGILAGTASQAAFTFAYSVAAQRVRWYPCLAVAVMAFAGVTVGLNGLEPLPVQGLEIAVGAIALGLALMPRSRAIEPEPEARLLPVRYDVAARAVVATAFVVVLTALSARLGPTLAGLLSPFPLFASVLIVFPHRLQGRSAAISACRGFLWGLFASATFAFVLAQLLPNVGLAASIVISIVCALVVQSVTLLIVRRGSRRGAATTAAAGITRE